VTVGARRCDGVSAIAMVRNASRRDNGRRSLFERVLSIARLIPQDDKNDDGGPSQRMSVLRCSAVRRKAVSWAQREDLSSWRCSSARSRCDRSPRTRRGARRFGEPERECSAVSSSHVVAMDSVMPGSGVRAKARVVLRGPHLDSLVSSSRPGSGVASALPYAFRTAANGNTPGVARFPRVSDLEARSMRTSRVRSAVGGGPLPSWRRFPDLVRRAQGKCPNLRHSKWGSAVSRTARGPRYDGNGP